MERLAIHRSIRRVVVAMLLVVMAVIAIVVEPFPKGFVLLAITNKHGIDAGDLPAIGLMVFAAWLLCFRGSRRQDRDE
jgi:hypothetical protein